MLNINNISYKSDKAWNLISSGNTCGIFQLETPLGQTWARKVKPRNISELSDLIALLRPGTLQSGMSETYANRKNGIEPIETFGDPDVDKILKPTFNVLLYQEQLMALGSNIAWKDLQELDRLVIVDSLRKGIGKKDSKLLQSLKEKFINGCIKNGKTEELANKLFGVIQDAGRYSFNSAHSIKYAVWAYRTAYVKANFPYEFYAVYLTYSRLKQKPREEIQKLVNEANMLNIKVFPPSILEQNREFRIITKNGKKGIAYGLSHIKQVGSSDLDIICLEKLDTWQKLLLAHFDPNRNKKLRSPCVESLICSGSCDSYNVQRSVLLEIFKIMKGLTGREIAYVTKKLPNCSLEEFPNLLKECANKVSTNKRKHLVESEAIALDINQKDTFAWRAEQEKDLLGLNMSCSAIDDKENSRELTCKECYKFSDNNKDSRAKIAVVLDNIYKLTTKRGKNPGQEMAQLQVSDSTGYIRIACFPEQYAIYKDMLHEQLSYEIEISGTGNGWCVQKIKGL